VVANTPEITLTGDRRGRTVNRRNVIRLASCYPAFRLVDKKIDLGSLEAGQCDNQKLSSTESSSNSRANSAGIPAGKLSKPIVSDNIRAPAELG